MTYTNTRRATVKATLLGAFTATAVAFLLLLGAPPRASAQSVCTTHAQVMKQLDRRFSETPVAMGLADNGGIVEVYSSKDGATWTMVLTTPNGMSCLIASGEAWESLLKLALGPQA